MNKKYCERDYEKLRAVLAHFELLEQCIGQIVTCLYFSGKASSVEKKASFTEGKTTPSILVTVERFRKIVIMPHGDEPRKKIDINFLNGRTLAEQIILQDLEIAIFANNRVKYIPNEIAAKLESDSKLGPEKLQDLLAKEFAMSEEAEWLEVVAWFERYFELLRFETPELRRELFGNIIADIEEDYFKKNGHQIYDLVIKGESSGNPFLDAINDIRPSVPSYMAILDYYQAGMPDEFSVYPTVNGVDYMADSKATPHL